MTAQRGTAQAQARRRLVWGGVAVGIGIGGFFDGIVFHQILQWHHMVSNLYPVTTVAGLEVNTLGDGLFHAGTYAFMLVGLVTLWSVARKPHKAWPAPLLFGTFLVGWGLFNVLEGVVNHHLLGVHHVRAGPDQGLYDVAFLGWGAAMLVGGWLTVRRSLARLGRQV